MPPHHCYSYTRKYEIVLSCKIHHCTTISTNRALKNRAQLRRENCAGRVATENRTIEVNIRAVSAVLELFVGTFLNRP